MRATLIIAAASVAAALTIPGQAQAQANRTFVSGQGSDSNPCSLSAPCRSFAQAITQTNAGGEIVALDAAGYGTLNITKAITVTAIGIAASITTSTTTTTGITINAGASDVVKLRGLSLYPGASGNGVEVNTAKSVTLEDCTISGFSGDGIVTTTTGNLNLTLRRVSSDNNGGNGLDIAPGGSGTVTVAADTSHFGGNGSNGVEVLVVEPGGAIKATLSVVAEDNGNDGIDIVNEVGAIPSHTVVAVTGSKVANNGSNGVEGNSAGSSVMVFVDRTEISGNATGWQAAGNALVKSFTNNAVGGNGSDALNGVTEIAAR